MLNAAIIGGLCVAAWLGSIFQQAYRAMLNREKAIRLQAFVRNECRLSRMTRYQEDFLSILVRQLEQS